MDNATLIEVSFAAGADLMQALDRATLSISVALWVYLAKYQDWRFLLASRRLDEAKPAAAYGLVHDAFTEAGILLEKTPPLMILRMSDPSSAI